MTYIDGFVAAVPKANKEAYRKHAADASGMFKEFGAGVEFLTLKEFRAWLAEYKLTSS